MIKLYLLKLGEGDIKTEKINTLSPRVREKIEKTSNEKLKRDRLITYLFLEEKIEKIKKEFCAVSKKRFFSDDFKLEIDFEENGKPFIKGIDCEISVSHTEGAALVAISLLRFAKIGADAEKITEKSTFSAQRFIQRRLADAEISLLSFKDMESAGITFEGYGISAGEFEPLKSDFFAFSDDNSVSDVEKWCALEALLKLDGGGFSSLSKIEKLKTENDCYIGKFKLGEELYAFSLAASRPDLKFKI